MSAEITSDQARLRSISSMGDDLGSLYHALWNELAWLYAKWGEYVEIFGTKPSRIDLVNQAAGHFFRVVQDSLWEDALLHVARLTDPPQSMKKDNLTVRRLPDLIRDEDAREKVRGLVETATLKADFCRDWRNRHIAHRDLKLALRQGAEPLKGASRGKVKEALDSLSDVLNAVSLHFESSTTSFEGVGIVRGALELLYVIDDGLRAKEERLRRMRAGEYRPEDYQPRDL